MPESLQKNICTRECLEMAFQWWFNYYWTLKQKYSVLTLGKTQQILTLAISISKVNVIMLFQKAYIKTLMTF